MTQRVQGSDALMDIAFEDTYGTAPVASGSSPNANYWRVPFKSAAIGTEQNMEDDDLLGQGRNPIDPDYGIISGGGDIEVPIDVYNFGFWLRALFGPPVTTASVAAQTVLTFSSQPAVNSTITLNGTTWTAVASGATGNQWNLGANLGASMTALATALNAASETQTAKCTYVGAATTLTITNDTAGPAGNAYTIAVSSTAHAKIQGAGSALSSTLKGGANDHVFSTGASVLPSISDQLGFPTTSKYRLNTGVAADSIAISQTADSTKLSAKITCKQQNEVRGTVSVSGTPNVYPVYRFSQFSGGISCDGVALGEIKSSDFTLSNTYEEDRVIRADGLLNGVDPGKISLKGSYVVRYSTDSTLDDLADSQTPFECIRTWTRGRGQSLSIRERRVFLPKPKLPVNDAGGIQATFNYQGSYDSGDSEVASFVLTNDLAGSVYGAS